MSGILRTNDEVERKRNVEAASAFAQHALGKVGGSVVYIDPKKTGGKLLDTDPVK